MMRKLVFPLTILFVFSFMKTPAQSTPVASSNLQFTTLLDSFYEMDARLNPVRATFFGDNRYNDLLPIDFTDSYRAAAKQAYQRFLKALHQFKREGLNADDQISYEVLQWQLAIALKELSLPSNLLVFTQFNG